MKQRCSQSLRVRLKSALSYDEIRGQLNLLLATRFRRSMKLLQRSNIFPAFLQRPNRTRMGWDDSKRMLHITDPYLRFFLRWQVRKTQDTAMLA